MRFIIITGSGHSGTTFLTNLLSHAPDIEVRHQYFGDRTGRYADFSRNVMKCLSYYQTNHPMLELMLRKQMEQTVAQFPELQTFVDVYPHLPYALTAVRRALDDVHCYHLVRTGREVVRSQYNGKNYRTRLRRSLIIPTNPSTLELWGGFSRFEKLCWLWNDLVSRLLEDGVQLLHLERSSRTTITFTNACWSPAGSISSGRSGTL